MNSSIAIKRLVEVCRRQHKALSTERVYGLWLKEYCGFVLRLNPELTSEKKLESFLTMLAEHRDVSASTQNQELQCYVSFCRFMRYEINRAIRSANWSFNCGSA
jgi:hypothetical protein